MGTRQKTYDILLQMKDAGLVAASAAATVSAVAKQIDVGLNVHYHGVLIIDVSAIEIASNDEVYSIAVQGGSVSGFGSGNIEDLAIIQLGAHEAVGGNVDTVTGRYFLPFTNEKPVGTMYQYLRVYTTVAGTVATGINYTAFISPL